MISKNSIVQLKMLKLQQFVNAKEQEGHPFSVKRGSLIALQFC